MQPTRFHSWLARAGLAGLPLLLTLLAAAPAHAGTVIDVNTTTDIVSPTDNQCSLREAINAANHDTPSGTKPQECAAGSGTDTITVPAGTIALGSTLPDITSPMAIVGSGMGSTIIDAQGAGYQALTLSSGGDLVLFSLTITRAQCTGCDGGAIFNDGGKVTLRGTSITDSSADDSAGAIFSSGTVLLAEGSEIAGNTGPVGGGIFSLGSLVIDHSSVINNSAPSGFGGGISAYNASVIIRNGSVISGNTAGTNGGGLYVDGSPGTLVITGSQIVNNVAGTNGGGIYHATPGAGTMSITSSCITGNSATAVAAVNAPQIATGDWWGSISGPGPARSSPNGDTVSAIIDTSGFLTAPPAGCGYSAPDMRITPVSAAFPDQLVNTTGAPRSVSVTNIGHHALVVSAITVYGAYSVSADGCTGQPVPPQSACTFGISFAPAAVGPQPGGVVVSGNTEDGPATLTLAGTGLTPAAPPALSAPKDGAPVYKPPKLAWKAVRGAPGYHVEVLDGSQSVVQSGDVTKPAFPTAALPFGIYSWHVAITESFGQGAYSAPLSFEVTLNKAPKKNAALKTGIAKFSWQSVKGKTYLLRITNGTAHTVYQTPDALSKPGFTVDKASPLPAGNYSWQVSIDGGTSWTPAWAFSVN